MPRRPTPPPGEGPPQIPSQEAGAPLEVKNVDRPKEPVESQEQSAERVIQDFESGTARMRDFLTSGDSPLGKANRALGGLHETVSGIRIGGSPTRAVKMVEQAGQGLAQLIDSIRTVSAEMNSAVSGMKKSGLEQGAISQATSILERLTKLQNLTERYASTVTPDLSRLRSWATDAYRDQLFSANLAEEVVGGAERSAFNLRQCVGQIENIKVKWEYGVRNSNNL